MFGCISSSGSNRKHHSSSRLRRRSSSVSGSGNTAVRVISMPSSISSGHGRGRSTPHSAAIRSRTRSRSGNSSSSRSKSLEQLALSSISAGSGGSAGREAAAAALSGSGRRRETTTPGSSVPWSQLRRTPGSATPRHAPQTNAVLALAVGRGNATGEVGLACLDPDAPVLVLSQLGDTYTYSQVVTKIHVLNPCEVLLPGTCCEHSQQLYRLLCEQLPSVTITPLPRHHFQSAAGRQKVAALCLPSLAGLAASLSQMYYCAAAAGALLLYMESVRSVVFRAQTLKVELQSAEATVMISHDACRRLELVQAAPDSRPEHTVYAVVRRTQTPGGCRRLRAELLQPSRNVAAIRTRQDCVQELIDSPDLLYRLRAVVGRFRDVEKIHSFCIQKHTWETERNIEQRLNTIIALKSALEFVEALNESLQPAQHPFFITMRKFLSEPTVGSLLVRLRAVLHDDVQPCRGGVEQRVQRCYAIKAGVNGMLDVARRLCAEATDEFVSYVSQQAEEHKLPLKPGFNGTRGFHVVCTLGRTGRLPQLPAHFIQVRQSRTTATFTTEEVIQMNQRADTSVEEICSLSNVVVCELLNQLQPQLTVLYQLAEVVSTTDLLVGFADLATSQDLRRPQFSAALWIARGWHPLLAVASPTPPVPADLQMAADCRLAVVSGANMSGKTTLLKTVAVIQIMAQLGSFVPAESAALPIVDCIFVRSGCEERAERQTSSFESEVRELCCILQQATRRSLVLLDELGRATAAEEGAALAWAACEALLRSQCRTLAATHFPQCSRLAELYPALVKNYHVGACDGDERGAPEASAEEAAARRHRVYAGPALQVGYGLQLAQTTSLSELLLQHAARLLSTSLHPPRAPVLSPRDRQERQLLQLSERLQQLHAAADQLVPAQLRATLRQLRDEFVQLQMTGGQPTAPDNGQG